MKYQALCTVFLLLAGCTGGSKEVSNVSSARKSERVERLKEDRDAVVKFFEPMKVREGDWLKSYQESGQTFEEYLDSNPTLPTGERKTLYVQPIGKFSAQQRNALRLAVDYLHAFYDLPVKMNNEKPIGIVPEGKSRVIYPKNRQIRTTYFLDDVLPRMLPTDAAALIAFTNYDLFPEETWHFVFGQASLDKRVGVWSLWRFADLKTRTYDPKLLLSRTLKVAVHETGHMFGMRHCTKYECVMSGTMHLDETDRRPLDACPECMAKIAWAMNYDPEKRYRALAEFWKKQGWADEERSMADKARAVAK